MDAIKNSLVKYFRHEKKQEKNTSYDPMINYLEMEHGTFNQEKLQKFLKIFDLCLHMNGNEFYISFPEKKEEIISSTKNKIANVRNSCALSQSKLAEMLGISQPFFSVKERSNNWTQEEKETLYNAFLENGVAKKRIQFLLNK